MLAVDPNLTAAQVRGLMRNATGSVGPASPAYDAATGWNAQPGYGRVNANAAVRGVGVAELVLGGGPGGAPRVFVLSGRKIAAGDVDAAQAAVVANFFAAGDAANGGGVRVPATGLDGDDPADVAVGRGEGVAAHVRLVLRREAGGGVGRAGRVPRPRPVRRRARRRCVRGVSRAGVATEVRHGAFTHFERRTSR